MALPYVGYKDKQPEPVYLQKKDNTMQSAGGLITTGEDLATWLKVQINQGKLGKKQIFPQEIITQSQSLLAKDDSRGDPFEGAGYGLGWQVGKYRGEKVVSHFGGFPGYFSHVSFLPEKEIGVAVLINDGMLGYRLMNLFATYAYDWWLDVEGVNEDHAEREKAMAERFAQVSERIEKGQADRAKRTWKLSQPFPHYSGTFQHEAYGTVEVKGSEKGDQSAHGQPPLRSHPLHQTRNDPGRMVPGSGEVIEFQMQGKEVTGFATTETVFAKVK